MVELHSAGQVRIRRADESCPDDETCPMLGTVPTRPGKVQGVGRVVVEPELLAAYAGRVGP
ncbi:MAG TPA: hypothetical protein VHZ97_28730, partial [Pseudonocardiaceae bacterium]|nr:hypothetical protein [Pseudonocardiaceae bacterium]